MDETHEYRMSVAGKVKADQIAATGAKVVVGADGRVVVGVGATVVVGGAVVGGGGGAVVVVGGGSRRSAGPRMNTTVTHIFVSLSTLTPTPT